MESSTGVRLLAELDSTFLKKWDTIVKTASLCRTLVFKFSIKVLEN